MLAWSGESSGYELGIALMEASLAWADETLRALEPAATAGGRP
jgi:hypothetical protein